MFQHSHRGTLVWLFIVGMALGLTLIAGEVPAAAAAALLAGYLALAWMVVRNVQLGNLINVLPSRMTRQPQPTEVAREAVARARNHPKYDSLVQLLDTGLIVDEQRPDGLALRRGRFITLDDDGVRPFAILHVPEVLGQRMARFRFELRDESGHPQYVYETEKWLDAGENVVLPDYRLPIRNHKTGIIPGGWSSHVMLDDRMLGIHSFSISPSVAERLRQVSSDGELRERVWRTPEEDDSLPLSLEELLRQQSRERRQS
jgi:hypothetical protein